MKIFYRKDKITMDEIEDKFVNNNNVEKEYCKFQKKKFVETYENECK